METHLSCQGGLVGVGHMGVAAPAAASLGGAGAHNPSREERAP